MRKNVIDLFSGCGGLSYGFIKAGCDILGFIECWKPAIETFKKNHPKAYHLGYDISKISNETLKTYHGLVDIVIGGPPCQGFSMAGKRDPKDKRNQLYKEFLRVIEIIKPRTIVIENVVGLLSMQDLDGKPVIDKILHSLIGLDYFVSYRILRAVDYGIAQNRKRLIIIAKKLDMFPEPTVERKTVIEAIGDLPFEESSLNGHVHLDSTEETLQKFKSLKQGEKMSSKFNFCRQRLYANKPSKTVVTIPLYVHPFYDRFLTPRELARLQSFSDDFEFCGSKSSMIRQVGNAVPPILAEAIARKIVEVER